MKTVAELRKENETLIAENGQMRQQLSQAAQMLQNNELASRQFELERVKALITMYTTLVTGKDKELTSTYLNDITESIVRVPQEEEVTETKEVELTVE
tara:strand:- start:5167 stop:5460 length:294 start_codon:yes stop_codon:yes gene_type:complete